jgi:hypothetical protein
MNGKQGAVRKSLSIQIYHERAASRKAATLPRHSCPIGWEITAAWTVLWCRIFLFVPQIEGQNVNYGKHWFTKGLAEDYEKLTLEESLVRFDQLFMRRIRGTNSLPTRPERQRRASETRRWRSGLIGKSYSLLSRNREAESCFVSCLPLVHPVRSHPLAAAGWSWKPLKIVLRRYF